MTVSDPRQVIEVDPRGKIAWQAPLPGKGYKAIRLSSGQTMVSTGGALTVMELDRAGKITLTAGGKQAHPDLGLAWFSGFDLLPNGNIVVANWFGHGKQGKGPHLVEFDRNNHLVWKWGDHRQAATITNVLVLDGQEMGPPGDGAVPVRQRREPTRETTAPHKMPWMQRSPSSGTRRGPGVTKRLT